MNLRFQCQHCQGVVRTDQVDVPSWTCPHCGEVIRRSESEAAGPGLRCCRVCGTPDLYIQKDFPQWLGMTILVAGFLFSAVAYAYYWVVLTWCILIGTALLDIVLYWFMGSVTVCYRCHAQHRGFEPETAHKPFELSIAERYRQEKLRREQLEQG